MRSLRELKALTIQPMRCRSDQNIAEILSKRPQQNSFQVVHFTSPRRFDDGQPYPAYCLLGLIFDRQICGGL